MEVKGRCMEKDVERPSEVGDVEGKDIPSEVNMVGVGKVKAKGVA